MFLLFLEYKKPETLKVSNNFNYLYKELIVPGHQAGMYPLLKKKINYIHYSQA